MRVASFERVSRGQFEADWARAFPGRPAPYDLIRLPLRATAGSAGYDFFSPASLRLEPGEERLVPTGIRARMEAGWVLMLFPRSGLGFKYRLMLNNTVGIIDADYYLAENEGHILVKLTNSGDKPVAVEAGQGLVQGIFLPFGITKDDDARGIRTSGFGSTDSHG